jgi:hypothetical protein
VLCRANLALVCKDLWDFAADNWGAYYSEGGVYAEGAVDGIVRLDGDGWIFFAQSRSDVLRLLCWMAGMTPEPADHDAAVRAATRAALNRLRQAPERRLSGVHSLRLDVVDLWHEEGGPLMVRALLQAVAIAMPHLTTLDLAGIDGIEGVAAELNALPSVKCLELGLTCKHSSPTRHG